MSELGVITISPRIAVHQELEETHQAFHNLLVTLDDPDLYQPSANPTKTVGDLLINMVMDLHMVHWKTNLIRFGFWFPGLPTPLAERLMMLLSRHAARQVSCSSIGRKYNRAYNRLLRTIHNLGDGEWQKKGCCTRTQMAVPEDSQTIESLFHSIPKNFTSHAEDILQRPLGLPAVLPQPPSEVGLRLLLMVSLFALLGGVLTWHISRKKKRKPPEGR
jgi:hypothetical protein